jgi:hypothetical protein
MFFPGIEVSDIVAAGVSIHGTGFDREALVPSIIVILFFVWTMRGAPVNEKAQGGFTLGWIILIGFIIFGLLAPGDSFGAARGWPSYATDGAELSAYLDRPKPAPWSGLPVTPIIILAVLWFVVPSDGGKAKAKPKSKASKPDPLTEALVESLRNGKRALIPAVPFLAFPALAEAGTGVATEGAAIGWGIISALCAVVVLRFYARRVPLLALAIVLCFFAGTLARADLWESDGERAVREAQAEKIRLEAQAAYQRELALLRAQGHVSAATTAEAEKNMVPITIVFVVAIGATFLYWRELRTREAREDELRRLQIRLAVAESRTCEAPFGRPSALLAMEDRHGRR